MSEFRVRPRTGEPRTWLRLLPTVVVIAVAVALDQVTKVWALANLETGRSRPLVGDVLTLQLVHNSGAAFSLGAGTTWIFTLLAVGIVGVIIWILPRTTHQPTLIGLGLLAGGAIGNLVDRLLQPPSFGQGHVVDFINYGGLFVGNVADIWIVGSAIWLALIYAFGQHGKPEPGEGPAPTTADSTADPTTADTTADPTTGEDRG